MTSTRKAVTRVEERMHAIAWAHFQEITPPFMERLSGMLIEAINTHVSNPAERTAVRRYVCDALRQYAKEVQGQ